MKRIIPVLIMFMTPVLLLSCSNLRHNVGQRGIIVDDEHIILDGDTFSICERINDNLLIISEEVYVDKVPDYLIKKEANGFYYMQTEANGISSIDGTEDFVAFTNRDVYDIRKGKVLFRTECDILEGFSYIGASDDKYLFCNRDSLCFSDGKCIGLQPDVFCSATSDKNLVRLTLGAQHMDVSPQELYKCIDKDFPKDATVEHFKKDYFIKPRTEYEYGRAGYDLDIEMPIGKNVADMAIRQWMQEQIRNEAFSLLELNPEDIPIPKCSDMGEFTQWLDRIGVIWEKLLRNGYQEGDTLYANISSHIVIRKIADNDEYTTFYFSSLPYTGGMHELPRSFYATYDRRRHVFLNASNSIKEETRMKFAMEALQDLKKRTTNVMSKKVRGKISPKQYFRSIVRLKKTMLLTKAWN